MSKKQVDQFLKYIQNYYPDNIPIPLGEKNPIWPHKDGQHTWEKINKYVNDNWGLVLKTLLIIDFDDKDCYDKWKNLFPEDFDTCPLIGTSKGYHCYFIRPAEYDEWGIFDRSRFQGPDGDDVDIKTICSTGTGGIVAIPPSKNKIFIRDFNDGDLQIPSENLLNHISNTWSRKTSTKKIENDKYVFPEVVTEHINEINPDFVNNIMSICPLLSKKRSDDYHSWIRTGYCLKTIADQNPKYVDQIQYSWIKFSELSDKFNYDVAINVWNRLYPGYKIMNYNTLESWVKIDNEVKWDSYVLKEYGYDNMKKIFNKTMIKTMDPVLFIQNTNNGYIFRKRGDLKDAFENKLYKHYDDKKGIVNKKFIDRWLQDPDIITYHTTDFMPPPLQPDCDNIYNLWKGFKYENILEVDISSQKEAFDCIFNHILLLTKGNKKGLDYLLKWFAHMVQYPGQLNNIAICFTGPEGIGKDVLLKFIGDIIGKDLYGQTDNPVADVFSQFASGPAHKLLYVVDEMKGVNGFKFDDRIKNYVTCDTVRLERKGKDMIKLLNFCRIAFTSNDKYVLNIKIGDRRFVIFESSDIVPDSDYFDKLRGYFNDVNVQKAFFKYLKGINVENYDWKKERPDTDIYRDIQKTTTLMPVKYFKYLYNECNDQFIQFTYKDYNTFVTDIEQAKNYHIEDATKWGCEINKYRKIGFIIKKRGAKCNSYIFDKEKAKIYFDVKIPYLFDDDYDE